VHLVALSVKVPVLSLKYTQEVQVLKMTFDFGWLGSTRDCVQRAPSLVSVEAENQPLD